MVKLVNLLFHRMALAGVALLIQISILVVMVLRFSEYFIPFYFFCIGLSALVVLWIVSSSSNPAYKIAWLIPILAVPVFGGLLFLLFGGNRVSYITRRRMSGIEARSRQALGGLPSPPVLSAFNSDKSAALQSKFITSTSSYPPRGSTQVEYFALGEHGFLHLLDELRRAERYIFLEYFIIEEGLCWNAILKVLEEKALQGVDVRIIYDDIGCMFTLPRNYAAELEKKGIACCVFNPFVPILSSRLNNRDHRKILIIDGHTGFTGGMNLADQYINARVKYGHWKDSAVMLRGEAVWNLTVMFLSMWEQIRQSQEDYSKFLPEAIPFPNASVYGIVQPFTDTPLDSEPVGEGVYLNLIARAERYIYFTTPYLIIDNTMTTALCNAAKSGVDVRIITPHIPDKQVIFECTRAHYPPLLAAGVMIYEYTPGFIHAKNVVCDDQYAVVGTINMDYRSLFLHFECAVWMYRCPCIPRIRDDFISTLESCQLQTIPDHSRFDWAKSFYHSILRVFSPLM